VPASLPGCFIPGEIAPETHWVGGLVDPRAGLDVEAKRRIPPLPGLNHGHPTCSQSLCWLSCRGSFLL